MPNRDADIEEAYAAQYDTEHGATVYGPGGEPISANSIAAHIAAEQQERIDRLFGHLPRD